MRSSPTCASGFRAAAASFRAASNRCWRSPGSCAPARAFSCSTSRPRAWRRSSSSRSAAPSPSSSATASPSSWSSRTSASPRLLPTGSLSWSTERSSTPSPSPSSRDGWTSYMRRWGCDDEAPISRATPVVAPPSSLAREGGANAFRCRSPPVNLFGHAISMPQLFGQLLIGLINGSFYALLSLGLAVIFGMLTIVNFAHGAFYMMGAFAAYFLLQYAGLNYWWALILSPLAIGAIGAIVERLFLKRLVGFDPLYSLLLTFGLALIIQGLFQNYYGASGLPYAMPKQLGGAYNLGFMFLPVYRGWVILASVVVCFATWLMIEKTKLGAYLRAATENPTMVRAFGINVPRMVTLTYGFGVALAAFAGVLAAPINQVRPGMGQDIIVVVFAVVVIGGMGSILGSILTGFVLGVIEGLTKVFYPEASNTVVFVIMAIVLLIRPAGLFGRAS